MRNACLLIALSIMLMSGSCKPDPAENPDPTTNVELNFKITYDGEPLVMGTEYQYDGMGILFSRFNFYISEAVLMKGIDPNSDRTELIDIEYMNATDHNISIENATDGVEFKLSEIPVGDYVGLKFGIGVPADMNRKSPQNFSDTHVLGINSDYWADWSSYIFSQVDGRLDTDNDQSYTLGFAYHSGTDDLYKERTFLRNITLEENVDQQMTFTIDIKKLFFDDDGNKSIDIIADPGTHNSTQLEIAETITDNLLDAIMME